MNAVRAYSGTILLYGLHLLIALSLPFILALVVGCTKIQEEEADYGEEVDPNSVELALSKAVHGVSLANTAVGQNLKYNLTRRLENEETTTLLGGTQVEVISREDAETDENAKFMLKVTQSQRTTSNGEFEVKIWEEPLIYQKAAPPSTSSLRSLVERSSVHAMADREVVRSAYYNLREFTQTEAPPKAVAERPGCGGLNPCEMQMRYVRFNMVQYFKDGGRQKVAFDFAFSINPPYLPFGTAWEDQATGLLVIDCRSTYVPIEGRTVYVRDCQNLEDFQK
jgi:hypothetical protein